MTGIVEATLYVQGMDAALLRRSPPRLTPQRRNVLGCDSKVELQFILTAGHACR